MSTHDGTCSVTVSRSLTVGRVTPRTMVLTGERGRNPASGRALRAPRGRPRLRESRGMPDNVRHNPRRTRVAWSSPIYRWRPAGSLGRDAHRAAARPDHAGRPPTFVRASG